MTNFVYDPKRQGYDTNLWKTLVGAPAVANSKIVLNEDAIIGYADLYGCDLTMRLIIPQAPQAGDIRQFGFGSAGKGALLVFDITEDVFSIKADDGNGNTKTVVVDFNSDWVGAETDFEIRWRGTYADFLINGVRSVDLTSGDIASYRINDIAVPKGPLSLYLMNEDADDMEVVTIEAKNIQTFI
jgi:hypothetical protein